MKNQMKISVLLCAVCICLFAGCATDHFSSLAVALQNDPAEVDASFQGWGASATFKRRMPTNWVPPAKVPDAYTVELLQKAAAAQTNAETLKR